MGGSLGCWDGCASRLAATAATAATAAATAVAAATAATEARATTAGLKIRWGVGLRAFVGA